jgi:hypothetical protein
MKKLLVSAAIAAAIAGGALSGASPANAEVKLGALDQFGQIKPWCQDAMSRGPRAIASTWLVTATPDNPGDPWSWRCHWTFLTQNVDYNSACKWAYHDSRAYGRPWSRSWAWSWDCFR